MHPHTVRIFDFGMAEDGTFYCTMEYLPGLTLQKLVGEHGPLPPGRAVHLLRQVCQALREAHGLGLIHRDIKPGNLIVGHLGGIPDFVKLLDFGLVQSTAIEPGGGPGPLDRRHPRLPVARAGRRARTGPPERHLQRGGRRLFPDPGRHPFQGLSGLRRLAPPAPGRPGPRDGRPGGPLPARPQGRDRPMPGEGAGRPILGRPGAGTGPRRLPVRRRMDRVGRGSVVANHPMPDLAGPGVDARTRSWSPRRAREDARCRGQSPAQVGRAGWQAGRRSPSRHENDEVRVVIFEPVEGESMATANPKRGWADAP